MNIQMKLDFSAMPTVESPGKFGRRRD